MSTKKLLRPGIEPLEARIAPAAVVAALPTIKDAETAYDQNPFGDTHFVRAVTGTPILLKAGQVLTTGSAARSGTYLMFVEKGQAFVFTTDFNNNGQVDYNEITGIAAGDGLRLTSFVDIHGDIVTNLDADGTLSDSDNNPSNNPVTSGDGRVLNYSSIEAITLRSLQVSDLTDQNNTPDKTVDQTDLELRFAFTSYSIFGEILAGKSFGVATDATSGLHIDDTGKAIQQNIFTDIGLSYYVPSKPTIGAIRTGTAANGEYFSFGYSRNIDIHGDITTFTPASGQPGGDISYVVSKNPYNLSGVKAGDGGLGARGGTISNVAVNGDNASGYFIIAGNGGRGTTGGVGGSILNFSDAGSITGIVTIKSGSGGQGTNGLGGNGGGLGLGSVSVDTSIGVNELANLNVSGAVSIELGNGGDGFRGGGAGASLTNLILRTPDDPLVTGNLVVSTTHDPVRDPVTHLPVNKNGVIGAPNSFDFDGDGNSDFVITTSRPEQLTVVFGDGAGGFGHGVNGFLAPLQLDGPSTVTAAAVADVNGDGHPDVIVGSSKSGDFSGVTVFLSQYRNNNGVEEFTGFSSPRTSALPSLSSGDPNGGRSDDFQFRNTSNPITSLATGDFDGDGRTDIAVTAGYVSKFGLDLEQVLIFLTPDVELPFGSPAGTKPTPSDYTGHFYADFGTKAANGQLAQSYVPFQDLGTSANAIVLSTALTTFDKFDVAVTLRVDGPLTLGAANTVLFDPFLPPENSGLQIFNGSEKNAGLISTRLQFDKIDTNRALSAVTPVYATLRDFTIADVNQDSQADFLALSLSPVGYLVGIQGDGSGGGTQIVRNPNTLDNAGYFMMQNPVSLRASVPTSNMSMKGVAILNTGSLTVLEFVDFNNASLVLNPGPSSVDFSGAGSLNPAYFKAYDTLLVKTGIPKGNSAYVYPYLLGSSLYDSFGDYVEPSNPATAPDIDTFDRLPLALRTASVRAGDGGDGVIGRGGAGGSLGSGVLKDNGGRVEGSIDITLPLVTLASVDLDVTLTGGNGGAGFSIGGAGGGISGVASRPNPDSNIVNGSVSLLGGDGGLGRSGAGGNGGNLASNSVYLGLVIEGGKGGSGLTGGNGGSVIGNGLGLYSDITSPGQIITAGNAGDGIRRGGAGGSVTNFHGEFTIAFIGDVGGFISYTAGAGGNAIAGPGGAGGDVNNVSPFAGGAGSSGRNLLAGDVVLTAGIGGNGSSGGRGGNVTGFINSESGSSPGLLVFIAGSGGSGSRGNGGSGGSVSNLSVSSSGSHSSDSVDPFTGDPITPFTYNHIIAGAGGASASGTGGSGGSVTKIKTNASDGTYAVAAGAGGEGLLAGGVGGSVLTLSLELGGLTSKGLVVAGSGGSAGAVLGTGTTGSPNIGGRIGKGGLGGSIVGFTQVGGIGTHVDLIAGDGGDSLNFAGASDQLAAKYVGIGGSVKNVSVQGTLGNIDPNIPIKSYNRILQNESMASFVEAVLRRPTDPALIDDSQGNVGVTVGGAGRLKSIFVGYDQDRNPIFRSTSAGATNGDLINVRARAVVAAVAGNVERIAAIHAVRDLLDINDPTHAPYVGTDKRNIIPLAQTDELQYKAPTFDGKLPDPLDPTNDGARRYSDEPIIDGGLIDGALVSGTPPKMTVGGRVVDLSFISTNPNVSLSHRFVKS